MNEEEWKSTVLFQAAIVVALAVYFQKVIVCMTGTQFISESTPQPWFITAEMAKE